jgi:glycosyltransferase involved in cell wall biosynthesis
VYRVGAALAELEVTRFLPRKPLDALMNAVDRVIVVGGTPAVGSVAARSTVPVILQVATLTVWERAAQVRTARGAVKAHRWLLRRLVSRLDSVGLRVAETVLVMNRRLQEWVERNSRAQRVVLAPPGVDTDKFVPGERDESSPYLLYMGRMADPRKNISGLLRAYALYRQGHSAPKRLVLAGMTRPLAEDAATIDDLNLGHYVEVRSPLSESELIALLQGASAFVSASAEEGLGLAFIEALACGVPVVTTMTDGASMVVRDGVDGAVVKRGADEEIRLANALKEWEDVGVDRRQVCRARAVEVFSIQAVSRRILDEIVRVPVSELTPPA